MNTLPALSVRAYAALVALYPVELRREFGSEIVAVFGEDLANAVCFRGFAGFLSVWWCALREFGRIALPAQAENRLIAVPCILFALEETFLALQQTIILGLGHHPVSLHFILATAAWPSLLASLTSVVVVIVGKQCPLFPLRLGPDSCSKHAI
jgi:hypothetical protein